GRHTRSKRDWISDVCSYDLSEFFIIIPTSIIRAIKIVNAACIPRAMRWMLLGFSILLFLARPAKRNRIVVKINISIKIKNIRLIKEGIKISPLIFNQCIILEEGYQHHLKYYIFASLLIRLI